MIMGMVMDMGITIMGMGTTMGIIMMMGAGGTITIITSSVVCGGAVLPAA
jgi:hypothetical protein